MPISESRINIILVELTALEPVTHKKCWRSGIFKEGKMFGMLKGDGVFLLKADDSNRQDYLDREMPELSSGKKGGKMPYYEVPPDIIQHSYSLVSWAKKYIDITQQN